MGDKRWKEVSASFQASILNGNHREALDMAVGTVHSQEDVQQFYLHVIKPSMYRIGDLWEQGHLSVANEHLASSIVGRIMSALYIRHVPGGPGECRAVITAAPNEFHEIGAIMVSDMLEMDGWQVFYLGANTPTDDVVKMVSDIRPDVLAISVTMPFSMKTVQDIITRIRTNPGTEKTKVMVGGLAFQNAPGFWNDLGADGFCADAGDAVQLARKWCCKKSG